MDFSALNLDINRLKRMRESLMNEISVLLKELDVALSEIRDQRE